MPAALSCSSNRCYVTNPRDLLSFTVRTRYLQTTSAYVIISGGSPSPALSASSWIIVDGVDMDRPLIFCVLIASITDIKLSHAADGK